MPSSLSAGFFISNAMLLSQGNQKQPKCNSFQEKPNIILVFFNLTLSKSECIMYTTYKYPVHIL